MADPTRDQFLDAAFVVENLADLVRERRDRERLTTLAVAIGAGIDHGNLSRILRGERGVTGATAVKLINWLGSTT